jgi:predicted nucleotidyltransferase
MHAIDSLADLTAEATLGAVGALCVRHQVRQLDLFGSALTDRFDPARSDLDMLVTFEDLPPKAYADAYFGLKEDLKALLGREVELVTAASVINPYLRREIETHRHRLFSSV